MKALAVAGGAVAALALWWFLLPDQTPAPVLKPWLTGDQMGKIVEMARALERLPKPDKVNGTVTPKLIPAPAVVDESHIPNAILKAEQVSKDDFKQTGPLHDCGDDVIRRAVLSMRYSAIACRSPQDGKVAMFMDDKNGIYWVKSTGVQWIKQGRN